jgi:hypothetical protein
MRNFPILLLSFCFFLIRQDMVISAEIASTGQEGHLEKYYYEAKPPGQASDSKKQEIEAEFFSDSDGIKYNSKIISHDSIEAITINMLNGGGFVSCTRTVNEDSQITKEEIRIDENVGHVKKTTGDRTQTGSFKTPKDKKLACDASLLWMFRSFPFNSNTQWEVFMVDFSGETITVTVRHAGTENIVVPAGEFQCYRMEVIVHILILRPKLTFWITKDEPHFMVKSIGKRGPFVPNYITVLKAIEGGSQ